MATDFKPIPDLTGRHAEATALWEQYRRMMRAPFGCWSDQELTEQYRRAMEAQRLANGQA